MRMGSDFRFEATIPAEFLAPGWDIMYVIEAVDESGAGAFFPDFGTRDPFVVVPVRPARAP